MTDWNRLYFREPLASGLLRERIRARHKRRISYDCMNSVVKSNDTVACKKGHRMKRPGRPPTREGMPLLAILKGMCSSACRDCPDYDGEENE